MTRVRCTKLRDGALVALHNGIAKNTRLTTLILTGCPAILPKHYQQPAKVAEPAADSGSAGGAGGGGTGAGGGGTGAGGGGGGAAGASAAGGAGGGAERKCRAARASRYSRLSSESSSSRGGRPIDMVASINATLARNRQYACARAARSLARSYPLGATWHIPKAPFGATRPCHSPPWRHMADAPMPLTPMAPRGRYASLHREEEQNSSQIFGVRAGSSSDDDVQRMVRGAIVGAASMYNNEDPAVSRVGTRRGDGMTEPLATAAAASIPHRYSAASAA